MIKALLVLSIATNIVLGYVLLTTKPETEVIERLIIETHKKDPEISLKEESISLKAAALEKTLPSKDEKESEIAPPELFMSMESHEFLDAGERMESERRDFLVRELGFSEEKITRHQKIRDEYYNQTAQFWEKNPMRELSFKERRQMLQMEEELHRDLEELYGKENWTRYQQYREEYNARGYQKQLEDGQPFLFMGI